MFRGIWKSVEGFGEVSRDLEKFRRICRSLEGFWKGLMDFEKFWWILRSFDVFGEVLRDLEKFWGTRPLNIFFIKKGKKISFTHHTTCHYLISYHIWYIIFFHLNVLENEANNRVMRICYTSSNISGWGIFWETYSPKHYLMS